MQLEIIELGMFGAILAALVVLIIGSMLDTRTDDTRKRKTGLYGVSASLLLLLYFIGRLFTNDVTILVLLYGSALTFIPIWILSSSRPKILDSWKIPLAIMFLMVWVAYVGTRLLTEFALTIYFVLIIAAITLLILLVTVPSDPKALVAIIGLFLFFLAPHNPQGHKRMYSLCPFT